MAGNEDLVTYLSLAPEFGGTRFGPFDGLEVRLGSNPERCHIVLPEALGVVSEHVKLIRQGPQNLILAPADQTATVFLWKQGERRPSPLYTPTAVRPGDAFSLVTQDGPRFIIEIGELPPEIKQAREVARRPKTGRNRLSADAFAAEGKRQIWTRLLVLGPMQFLQRAWVYITSGAIYQPRNIIMFATIALAMVFGGFAGCRMKKMGTTITKVQGDLDDCKEQTAFLGDKGQNIKDYTLSQLASEIIRSNAVGTALNADNPLLDQVKQKAVSLSKKGKDYQWVVDGSGNQSKQFLAWRDRVVNNEDLDEDTRRLLVWVGAHPGSAYADFNFIPSDSEGARVCVRGPMRLTYRQALNLGLTTQPDAYAPGKTTDLEADNAAMAAKINESLIASGILEPSPEDAVYKVDELKQGEDINCVYRDGTDDRSTESKLLKGLGKAIGKSADGLPEEGENWAGIARIATLYLADLKNDPGVNLSDTQLSPALDDLDTRGAWAMERTAETIAKAMVLPCRIILESKDEKVIEALLGDQAPDPVACLIFNYKLQSGDL